MRIGYDVDGVLADFNAAFIERVIAITGEDRFPPRPFDIPTWDYPQYYGYCHDLVSKVWDDITKDPMFWLTLPAYADAAEIVQRLINLGTEGHEIYFITSRPGVHAKRQSEQWLIRLNSSWGWVPTVLISSAKGACARALKLDYYIDDRWENCLDVLSESPRTKVALINRPWNAGRDHGFFGITRVDTASVEGLLAI